MNLINSRVIFDRSRRCGAMLAATILLAVFGDAEAAVINAASAALTDVQNGISSASDGDTVAVPAGTASWTSTLNISKGITLQGATTIAGDHTTSMTATDSTVILDDTPRTGATAGIINVAISSSQSFRLTGFTFQPGTSTTMASDNGAIHLASHDTAPCTSMRVDHCHFASLYQCKYIWVSGWVYGVADHNIFDCRAANLSFLIWQDTWGGTTQINGNGSWADYPWYGTSKFFFIEDNTITGTTVQTSGTIDAKNGARYVARYNTWNNAQPSGHGTEAGIQRGMRAYEVYRNTFNWTYTHGGGEQRSGASIWHDNSWTGVENNGDGHTGLANYREISSNGSKPYNPASGANPWDVNDTEGNGTNVPGHSPYLYKSGTDNSSVNSKGVVHDSTQSWTTNQWAGYSVINTNPTSPCYGYSSYIISNTSNALTYYYYLGDQGSTTLIFNSGDSYSIYKILTQLDQTGRGKSDQLTGTSTPINSTTGTAAWPHNAQEPCYSWNNVHTPTGHALGYASGYPTNISNRDYYNLGAGFAAGATPSAVSSRYTAALNGVAYSGPYVYPHPLVSGVPAAPSSLRILP